MGLLEQIYKDIKSFIFGVIIIVLFLVFFWPDMLLFIVIVVALMVLTFRIVTDLVTNDKNPSPIISQEVQQDYSVKLPPLPRTCKCIVHPST